MGTDTMPPPALPSGVRLTTLDARRDERGVLTELLRREWDLGIEPVQWNVVTSDAGVLRGVHVHIVHDDYLVLVQGRAVIGLRDLRAGSETEGVSAIVPVDGHNPVGILIPHGVAHGFCYLEPSIHMYCVSAYWSTADELGCSWNDPELEIDWPIEQPRVSERDATAGSLADLIEELGPRQPIG